VYSAARVLRRVFAVGWALLLGSASLCAETGCRRRIGTAPTTKTMGSAAPAEKCLSIVSWNDMHGQLGPDESYVQTGKLPAGGVVAVADVVADVRATHDATVVLDAGDLFTGPLETTLAEGEPIIAAYNVLGVDAAAIGNHEFDFGPVGYGTVVAAPGLDDRAGDKGPRGALLARLAAARFPFLSANLHRDGGGALAWPHHAPATTVERDGFKVGVVGYTTLETPKTTIKPNVVGLDFATNAGGSIAASIRLLRAQGAAPVVLLAHASLEGELPQALDKAAGKGEIDTLLGELGADLPDLVVAGHRHAWLLGRTRGVPIVSTSEHGVGVARSRFCVDPTTKKLALASIERRIAVAHDPPRSALGKEVAAVVAPFQAKVAAEADASVATLGKACFPQRLDGSAFSHAVAVAIREHAADGGALPDKTPVVAVMNSGGVRAPLGPNLVRYRDLFAALPFENAVATCTTTRAGLAKMLSNVLRKASVAERFPFGFAGAVLALKRDAKGLLTLEKLTVPGADAETDKVVVAMPDFLLWGGDGFLDGVTCSATTSSQTRLRDAFRALLARDKTCDGPHPDLTIEVKP